MQHSQCPSTNKKLPHMWRRKMWLNQDKTIRNDTEKKRNDAEMAETMEIAY